MNIINLGFRFTNYYALEIKSGYFLIDCGWPGMMGDFTAVAKRKGLDLREIKYILVTHFHMDHAGLAQDVKNLGAKLIVMEGQEKFIAPMADQIKKDVPYTPIRLDDNLPLKFSESRAFLAKLGLDGEILPTPGHSNDHVTLILDNGSAFTGDLPPRFMITDDQIELRASWDKIYQHKIMHLYPGHGNST